MKMIEHLECRSLCSVTLHGGLLTVTGTEGSDIIRLAHPTRTELPMDPLIVDRSITRVEVNQTQVQFSTKAIRRISIDAGGGDDLISLWTPGLDLCHPVLILNPPEFFPALPTRLIGGAGADHIIGGRGRDRIFGGRGADSLLGNDGNDRLRGGLDDDGIDGGTGNDILRGGAGNDALGGGMGNDRVHGHNGNDLLIGLEGDDHLLAGLGDDTLRADSSGDILSGGRGDDLLVYPRYTNEIDGSVPPPTFPVPTDIERQESFLDVLCV